MKPVNVIVKWYPKEEGGRVSLPSSCQYSTVAKFKEYENEFSHEAWSIVLDFKEPPSEQGRQHFATARFLSENGPFERLNIGSEFDLYEGFKRVAHVEVIPNILDKR